MQKVLPISLVLVVVAGCSRSRPGDGPVVVTPAISGANQRCAELAAHPADKKRLAQGVMDEAIVAGLAVPACQQAVAADPGNKQLEFQLARALAAAGQDEQAREHFTKAAAYCGSGYYRAEVEIAHYWRDSSSWAPIQKALEYLEPENGCFAPSAELATSLAFDAREFPAPKIADALWKGRVDDLNRNRIGVAHVLTGFQNHLSEMVATFDAGCPARLVTQDVSQGLAAAVSGDPRSTIEGLGYRGVLVGAQWLGGLGDTAFQGDADRWREYLERIGRRMADRLTYRSCLSPVAVEIYKGTQLFAATPRPLADYLPELIAGKGFDLIPLPAIAPLVAREQGSQQQQ